MSGCSPVATLRTLRRHNRWFDGFTPEAEGGVAPLSVNVSGYLRDESGWGAAARGYVRALRRLGVPTGLADFSALTSITRATRSGSNRPSIPTEPWMFHDTTRMRNWRGTLQRSCQRKALLAGRHKT